LQRQECEEKRIKLKRGSQGFVGRSTAVCSVKPDIKRASQIEPFTTRNWTEALACRGVQTRSHNSP